MSRQQINLYRGALRPQRVGVGLDRALWIWAGTVLVLLSLSAWLAWMQRHQHQAQADTLRSSQAAQIQALKSELEQRRRGVDAELSRVRAIEQAMAKVQASLRGSADAASAPAYSAFFEALANQAHGALWITGFSVSPDGQSLELRGRALDASAVPDYLARLNAEPVFRGRQFAQLSVNTVGNEAGADAGAVLTEFVLRSGLPGTEPKEAR
ncbi:PilN domain-containing protein [Ideonella sp. 4Y11]|uniref:PilN domain-containing protein n=1 Tax=Ideonella aquatica TaxID=2824119 RepID=A0A941BKP7_9BURK|nr:PilN domain-containing protein [Ideonella aquatica]MBQ0958829.1 PilN domain-containing protein [Ideonella aquatica]